MANSSIPNPHCYKIKDHSSEPNRFSQSFAIYNLNAVKERGGLAAAHNMEDDKAVNKTNKTASSDRHYVNQPVSKQSSVGRSSSINTSISSRNSSVDSLNIVPTRVRHLERHPFHLVAPAINARSKIHMSRPQYVLQRPLPTSSTMTLCPKKREEMPAMRSGTLPRQVTPHLGIQFSLFQPI